MRPFIVRSFLVHFPAWKEILSQCIASFIKKGITPVISMTTVLIKHKEHSQIYMNSLLKSSTVNNDLYICTIN